MLETWKQVQISDESRVTEETSGNCIAAGPQIPMNDPRFLEIRECSISLRNDVLRHQLFKIETTLKFPESTLPLESPRKKRILVLQFCKEIFQEEKKNYVGNI